MDSGDGARGLNYIDMLVKVMYALEEHVRFNNSCYNGEEPSPWFMSNLDKDVLEWWEKHKLYDKRMKEKQKEQDNFFKELRKKKA